ncbi:MULTISPECIES: membrane protein [Streptacidiphilus]|uniref:Uncharacterized protein n=1 Tax=Streptacidiphilus cavernicola TaxID=3342716 RepID=A0ABV6UII9_9ACTN|nr:membrane protein [Streptacidiphilus jeojiense]
MTEGERLRRARIWIVVFMVGLVLAGLTAFPLVTESRWLVWWATDRGSPLAGAAAHLPSAVVWIQQVHQGLVETSAKYPFLAYGTDWLAFAHLTIAVAFLGPLRDPIRNIWVLDFGLIACVGIVPLALVCGPLRGLPLWWLPIDISFGLFGAIPLWLARRHIKAVEYGRTDSTPNAQVTAPA